MRSVGRNDPCPCGSGKKFKRCHGGSNPTASTFLPEAIPSLTEQVGALERRRRHSATESVCRSALQIAPNESVALERSGIRALRHNNLEDAIALLTRAAALEPERATAHYNLATAYIAAFRFAEAKDRLWRAIELNPEFAEAYNNLGNLHKYLGDQALAIRNYARATEIAPNNAARSLQNQLLVEPFRSSFAHLRDTILEKWEGRSIA